MGISRADVYICNVIKCRPPDNRNPEPDEVAACEPFLFRQIDLVRPRAIVGLGTFAVQAVLKVKIPISKLRGNWQDFRGIRFMPTFHPAYLLRTPSDKRLVWADIQEVMKYLGMPIPRRGGSGVVNARARVVFVVAAVAIAAFISQRILAADTPAKTVAHPPWVELITIDGSINPATALLHRRLARVRKCRRRRRAGDRTRHAGRAAQLRGKDRQGDSCRADTGDRVRRAVGRQRRVRRHLHHRGRERSRDGSGNDDRRGTSGGGGRRRHQGRDGSEGREFHRDLRARDRATARAQRRLGRAGGPPQRRDRRARGAGEERHRYRRAGLAQPVDASVGPQGPGRRPNRDARDCRRDGAPRADDARAAAAQRARRSQYRLSAADGGIDRAVLRVRASGRDFSRRRRRDLPAARARIVPGAAG